MKDKKPGFFSRHKGKLFWAFLPVGLYTGTRWGLSDDTLNDLSTLSADRVPAGKAPNPWGETQPAPSDKEAASLTCYSGDGRVMYPAGTVTPDMVASGEACMPSSGSCITQHAQNVPLSISSEAETLKRAPAQRQAVLKDIMGLQGEARRILTGIMALPEGKEILAQVVKSPEAQGALAAVQAAPDPAKAALEVAKSPQAQRMVMDIIASPQADALLARVGVTQDTAKLKALVLRYIALETPRPIHSCFKPR